jgi:hypothetical protein
MILYHGLIHRLYNDGILTAEIMHSRMKYKYIPEWSKDHQNFESICGGKTTVPERTTHNDVDSNRLPAELHHLLSCTMQLVS